MRAPEALRSAIFTTFDETPPDWVCILQVILTSMEGHSVSVRAYAERWKVSKSKAHNLTLKAEAAAVELGILGLPSGTDSSEVA